LRAHAWHRPNAQRPPKSRRSFTKACVSRHRTTTDAALTFRGWNAETGRKLWEITLFRNFIKPWLEECVQWVFIKEMRIENGKLIVLAERDRVYSIDLKTRAVRRLKSVASTSARE
jgi:hypothetical protein